MRFALRPDFDVTPEAPAAEPAPAVIQLGEVLDRNLMPAGPFAVSADSLNRHVFVCGATGAGKSQTVRCLLEAATERGIPWLVVEPAKAEYRLMASRLPGTRGDQDQAGRAGRDRGRAQPARARGATARAAGSRCRRTRTWSRRCSSRPSRPRSRSRRCSAPRSAGSTRRRAGTWRSASRARTGRQQRAPPTRRSPACSAPPSGSWPRSATASGSPTTCSASSGSGWPASGTARPGGSSRAGTRSTSARCCGRTSCSRSRTSATTRTRRS